MQLQVILNVTGFRPILRGALKREGVGGRGQDTAEFSLFQISWLSQEVALPLLPFDLRNTACDL